MKILAIRGENIASLEGAFEIDFTQEPLSSAGIFAISGPTGAGKSTLLDTMCLALFGCTPRTEQARENKVRLQDVNDEQLAQSDPRFLLRRGTASGYAEVDFVAIDGHRFRARWAVARAREKENGRLKQAQLSLWDLEKGEEISGTRSELQARIVELIGLTFDQFTRSVLLAQNDFSTFLKADQGEKALLLEKLTGTEQYSALSRLIFEKNAQAKVAFEEIQRQIPRSLSSADSLLMAESLVKKWVKDALVYEVALRNLEREERAEVDRLVEEYRHSLIRYRYEEQLVRERLSSDFQESDKLRFYEENQSKFVLDKALIKGLFLKVPADAPGLADVKKWYRSTSESAVEKIEKYSVQNAVIYDYFYDKWVDFDQVMDNIPMRVTDANAFLKANRYVEMCDSTYCYLLNISDYLPIGRVAPYDYAGPQIIEMLTNQRKVQFLKDFEDELYNDAVKHGDVEFPTTP